MRKYNVTRAGEAYGITVSVMAPEAFPSGSIAVSVDDAQGLIAAKTLSSEDLDFYVTVRPRQAGELSVRLDAAPALLDAAKVKVEFSPLSLTGSATASSIAASSTTVATLPNGAAKSAQTIDLGRTVVGADDGVAPGFQWFRFVAKERKLVYFVLETRDRDLPPGLDIFDEEVNPYSIGTVGYTPEASQNFSGTAPFRTHVVERGATYYVRVAAKHPEFRLRTDVYDVPPQTDPRMAVRTGMDFLANYGEVGRAPARPAVNPFEMGLRTWLTQRLAGETQKQHETEHMLEERAPANVMDLAWKIAALKTIGGHATGALVDELYRWRRDDGSFPAEFEAEHGTEHGSTSPGTEYSTFQALYALALAGRDARVEKTTHFTMAAQRPDGSWQEGFNTSVRDTQLAVMALRQLFPDADAPTAVAAKARTEHLDELLADLDSAPAAQAKRVLNESSWVLARAAAADMLGRAKDRDAILSLARALGDPSKIVQRAAAQALQEMDAATALLAALHSGNARVRWGALQAFQQNSKPLLAGHMELLAELKDALRDPVPQNRLLAATALSRWTR